MSGGGSDLFTSYEQDFTSITESVKSKIEHQIPTQKGGNSKISLNKREYADQHFLFDRGKKSSYSCSRKRT